jgi:hypothetical protein
MNARLSHFHNDSEIFVVLLQFLIEHIFNFAVYFLLFFTLLPPWLLLPPLLLAACCLLPLLMMMMLHIYVDEVRVSTEITEKALLSELLARSTSMRGFQAAAVLLVAASLCLISLATSESQSASSGASSAKAAGTINSTACREKGFAGAHFIATRR